MGYYICSTCGYGSASWMGRCPNCNEWNTFEQKQEESKIKSTRKGKALKLTPLSKVQTESRQRKKTSLFEFDRVISGGIIPGEAILLTGEPGIGKSTLLLQVFKDLKTIYISGEESAEQITDRAKRLKTNLENLLFSDNIEVEEIINGIQQQGEAFDVLVIDSLQTLYSTNIKSAAGGITQLKETLSQLISFTKKTKISLVVIGHVTKEGRVAGPKTIEHLVDCVLTFEGDKLSQHRILRATKNRFGSVDEVGIFEMKQNGLVEVNDPLAFLEEEENESKTTGKAIVGVAEGKRSLFFEIQSLTVATSMPYPRRVVKGVDYNKILLLLATVQKQLGIPLDRFDIYVNVVGGVSVKSTAADLGIVASVISSVRNLIIPRKTAFIGEVGLLGEIRKVSAEEKIIQEARRLKFRKILSSQLIKNIRELRKILF